MPAPPLNTSFEGGSNGTVLTTGNTGGASGNAASAVTDPNSIQKFSNAQAAHGSLSCNITQTATPTATFWQWTNLGTITTSVWFRAYLFLPALPSGTNMEWLAIKTQSGGGCAGAKISTGGVILVFNAAGTTVQTGAVVVPTNQWFRFEYRVLPSTTVGELEWRLYKNADSTVADEAPAKATSVVLGTDVGQMNIGNTFSPPASMVSYFDDVSVSSTNWIGPFGQNSQAPPFSPIIFPLLNTPVQRLLGFPPPQLAAPPSSQLFQQALTATVSTVASFTNQVNLNQLSTTVSLTGTIVKQVNKTASTSVSLTASVVKQVNKILSASVTLAASIQAMKVILVTLSATVSLTASIARQVGKNLSASASITASMLRQAGKNVTASVTATPSMVRQVGKILSASVTTTASLLKTRFVTLTTSVATSPVLTAVFHAASTAVARLRALMGVGL